MKRFSFSIVFLILVVSYSAYADQDMNNQTQVSLNSNSCENFTKADEELNKIYKDIFNKFKSEKLFLEKLKKAQLAWIVYRDAHIESVYPSLNPQTRYGSVYPMCVCAEKAEITRQRVEDLKRFLSKSEGDVCGVGP